MIEIKIPEQNNKLIQQLENILTSKGLIIIADSSDQNWNTYIINSIISGLMEKMETGERLNNVVAIGEKDQYSPEWIKFVDIKDALSAKIVFAGNIRDKDKAYDVINIAKTHIVIAILHTNNMQSVKDRLEEFGISKEDIEQNLIAVICKENDIIN